MITSPQREPVRRWAGLHLSDLLPLNEHEIVLIEIGPLSWMLNIDDRLPLVVVMPPISWLCWTLDLLKFFFSDILGECGVSYEVIMSNTLSRVSFPACFNGLQTPVTPSNACAVQAVVITFSFAHAVMMTTTCSLSEASQVSLDMYYYGAWPCYPAREIGLYDEYVYSQLLYLPAWFYLSSCHVSLNQLEPSASNTLMIVADAHSIFVVQSSFGSQTPISIKVW